MKILLTYSLCSVLIFSCCESSAADQDTRPSELAYTDNKLNILYKKILSNLDVAGKSKLKKAQKAWVIFRNLDCEWAFAAEHLDCLIDRTDNRVEELKNTYFFDKEGSYGAVK